MYDHICDKDDDLCKNDLHGPISPSFRFWISPDNVRYMRVAWANSSRRPLEFQPCPCMAAFSEWDSSLSSSRAVVKTDCYRSGRNVHHHHTYVTVGDGMALANTIDRGLVQYKYGATSVAVQAAGYMLPTYNVLRPASVATVSLYILPAILIFWHMPKYMQALRTWVKSFNADGWSSNH
jgi:hypothetical protein